ncbi:MAG: pyridoxamine 5'-phosphate oxidase family protein [Sandaracinaceae bacterium]
MSPATLLADAPTAELTRNADEVLQSQWPVIRKVWRASPIGFFATVDADGSPRVTPIGSVFLEKDAPRGYYLPKFTRRMRGNLRDGGRFQLLFLQTGAWPWLKGLVRGAFETPIAVRLKGHAVGRPRKASDEEVGRFQRLVRPVRWTKGYDLLWKDMALVQELQFDAADPIQFGAMRNG